VDGLVTCAGIQGEVGPALTSDPRNWSNTVRTNLEGTYYSIRAFAGLLRQSPRRAKIVCLSGGGATKARENFSAYGAAKTGVVRLVENIAAEAHHDPLDINAVAPGAINTRLTDEILSLGPEIVGANEYMAAVKQKAVALISFLLSAESDGISGRLLSAPWDKWADLPARSKILANSDVYTLRRIVPEDRGIVM
jgi:NAD(P)-dependent dehydrogenase (short-subunit alcohol dehydrogenase family)